MRKKVLARTNLEVSVVGIGTGALGIPTQELYIRQYTENPGGMQYADTALAVQTIHVALESGCTLIDTAPLYLYGQAEPLIRRALEERPDLKNRCTVTTKVGPVYPGDGFDWSYDRTMRSVEASMQRLGMERFEIVYIHDPMGLPMEFVMGKAGALGALRQLQMDGVVGFVGVAANDPETNVAYIETGEFDAAVVPCAWSLLNTIAAKRIFPAAERWNVGLMVATPLERGLLTDNPVGSMPYLFRDFNRECFAHVERIQALCRSRGVPTLAAAIQWCLRHPQVAAVLNGPRTLAEATENAAGGQVAIPDSFWEEIQPLVRHWELFRA